MIKFFRRFIFSYKEYFLFIILTVISLSLLFSNENPQVRKLKIIALGTFSVVNEGLSSVINFFVKDRSLEELKLENARLMLEVNKLRNDGLQNEKLRSILDFRDTTKFPIITADVTSKLVNKINGNIIINRGASDGIKIGMPVLTPKGLAGIIADVTENFSVVKTLYNSSLNISVTVLNNNIDGILSWDGNKLIIKNIPSTYDVKIGDIVETSDFSSLFPPKIPVGIVSSREELNIGLLHTLTIRPSADIYALHNVIVLKIIQSKQINNLEMNLMK